MHFEYDENKSQNNKKKHGIDFTEAQKLRVDKKMLEVPLDFPDESRWLCIGEVGGKCWSAVITYRKDVVRIISVRRSRKMEVLQYENC